MQKTEKVQVKCEQSGYRSYRKSGAAANVLSRSFSGTTFQIKQVFAVYNNITHHAPAAFSKLY